MNGKNLNAFACRVCLYEETDNITMECSNGWLKHFEYCFGVHIKTNEIARSLCLECADKIGEFAKLKRKCLESQFLWNSLPVLSVELGQTDVVNFNDGSECEELESKYDIDNESLKSNVENVTLLVSNNPKQERYTDQIDTKIEDCDHKRTQHQYNYSIKVDIEKLSDRDSIEYLQNGDKCLNLLDVNHVTDGYFPISENFLSQELITCECGKQYAFKPNYIKHVQKCHSVKFYNYQKQKEHFSEGCGLCEFTATDVTVLNSHLVDHFKKNDLVCQLCDYAGRDFAEMAYHRYTHNNVDKTLFCLKCHMKFSIPQSLQFHFRTVHLGKKGGLCSYCGLELSNMRTWKKHIKRKHADVNDPNVQSSLFVCDCCGVRFVDRCEIIIHLRERAGFFKSVCNVCGATFKRDRHLRYHIKQVHTKQERIKCPMCPRTCKTQMILKAHISNRHGEKKFVCEICSEKFRTETNFRYHKLGHTNERPYKCDTCPASYKTASTLRIHIRKHTGLKPYVCSICQMAFRLLVQLKRHNSMHTNEKPYKCESCDESFHYMKKLVKHCAHAHPNNLTEC